MASTKHSLTGSNCGVPLTHSASVSIALGRLRFGVLLCCLLVVIGLVAQAVIWSLVTFTDLRWTNLSSRADMPLVVQAEDKATAPARSALETPSEAKSGREPIDPNHVPGYFDRVFSLAASLSGGIGSLAAAALIPLIALGVLLAASSATEGVDRTVSAFGWGITVAFLCMPLADKAGLPWQDGAFWSYTSLTGLLDARQGELRLEFYARYLLLPAACGIGIALVASRFASGVHAGLMIKEDLRVDPALESEAANRKVTSLHGARTGTGMSTTMERPSTPRPVGAASSPSIRHLTAGEAPRRLI